LSNPRFQRWAASFPLTRPIARSRARDTFNLVAGFVYSQILLACVRLNLFEILAVGPQKVDALSVRLALSDDAVRRLMDAATALELLEKRGRDGYGLGRLGVALAGNQALHAMIEHHAMFYADLQDPVALLRGEKHDSALSAYWPYSGQDLPNQLSEERVAAYTELMAASQPLVAEEILDAVPLRRYRRLLDVGGGNGTFALKAAARNPRLELVTFDLPAVARLARRRVDEAGMAARIQVAGGNFLSDALPTGADIVSFVRIIHDHNDDQVLKMLRAARRALTDGGALLIAEPLSGTASARSMGDAYFGFYLLAMGSGRPRTAERLGELVAMAGFSRPRRVSTRLPLQTSVLLARAVKP
jgi:demethylspheroidene O-methyltransferase